MFRIGHSSDKKGTNTVMGYVAPRFLYHNGVQSIYGVATKQSNRTMDARIGWPIVFLKWC